MTRKIIVAALLVATCLVLLIIFLTTTSVSLLLYIPKTKLNPSHPKKQSNNENTNGKISAELKGRLENLRKTCQSYESENHEDDDIPLRLQTFSMEPKSRFVMCHVAKHGTTSWANTFVKLYTRDRKTKRTQLFKKKLEAKAFSRAQKQEVVNELELEKHNYTSFFVCRNPVEKFLSVYQYLMDARAKKSPLVMNVRGRADFQGRADPTWPWFLNRLANSKVYRDNYLGLLQPLFTKCQPCKLHYRMVIQMDTMDRDAGFLLRQQGLGWLAPAHYNSHGNNSLGRNRLAGLFRKVSGEDIRLILAKYRRDFEVCGYRDTLEGLLELAAAKENGGGDKQ